MSTTTKREVYLGSVKLGTYVDEETGLEAKVVSTEGISERSEVRGDMAPIAEGGGYTTPIRMYEGGRSISVEGVIIGEPADIHAYYRAIEVQYRRALLADEEVCLKWQDDYDGSEQLEIEVRPAGMSRVDTPNDGPRVIRYRLNLRSVSDNPRAQAEQQFAGDWNDVGGLQMDVINNGNVETYPTLVLRGPVTGPVIWNNTTGLRLKFAEDYALSSGELLTIRCAPDKRTVKEGTSSINKYGRLDTTLSEFWGLEPGINDISVEAESGMTTTTRLTVKWHDGWTS